MRFRKKPVVIDAVQYTGLNYGECREFCNKLVVHPDTTSLFIQTLEGKMECKVGDFLIKGVNGEFYPCKPDIFNKTYEKVE